ncbi:F-box domain-containing protein [Heracleum sosnowskyi]|uniref:F-box domain-containing protein n=1 Tax=Heracleum sosnowskyi TaxID=360622 RepID=A0AAD8HWZ9_9APIA|nr:F-box domain-containing protein [Heracleum sosnowskyi]
MGLDAGTRRLDCGAVAIDAIDRISNLPSNVIDLIVECLPLHDAARISILSKAWRDIWLMHPCLVFDNTFFKRLFKYDKQTQAFEVSRAISNILLVHNGPILNFHLSIPRDLPLSPCLDTDFWIRNISNNGVRKLELLNDQSAYKMPSYFFSCFQLTHLSLTNCIIDPPHGGGGFTNLLNVILADVTITADMSFGTQLKELDLRYCIGIEHLGSHFKYNNNLSVVKIFYSGELDWRLFECIQKAHLLTLVLKGVSNSRKETISLNKLVGKMPRISTLFLDDCFLKYLEPGLAILKRPITTLEKLYLSHVDVGLYDLAHIHHVLCLIRSSPNLRYLYIRLEAKANSSSITDLWISMVLPNNLILNQLETVDILGMVGSEAEFQFIKFLLASTPSLRWIKLKKHITVDSPHKKLRILQALLLIPRASTSSQIIWE